MKFTKIFLVMNLVTLFFLSGCSSFKAKRVDANTSDDKAMEITDKWVSRDTENVIKDIMQQLNQHQGFRKYLAQHGGKSPTLFIGEVQNMTSEAYFPINDINDELLNQLSATGEFVLVDAAAREGVLKEITYQNDGMVDPSTAKSIGQQTGADLMVFGNVYMQPANRDGKTIKEYAINIRFTDITKGVEVMRGRAKLYKYSEQSGSRW